MITQIHLNEKHIGDELADKERAKRDEAMKEEGRQEERNRQFLEFDNMGDEVAFPPSMLRNFPMQDHMQARDVEKMEMESAQRPFSPSSGGGGRRIGGAVSPTEVPVTHLSGNAPGVLDLLAEHPNRRSLTPLASIMTAVDSEVNGAEDLFNHMKDLKTSLRKRMQMIDDLAEGRIGIQGYSGIQQYQPQHHHPSFFYARSSRDHFNRGVGKGVEVDDEEYVDPYGPHVVLKHSCIAAAREDIGSNLGAAMNALAIRLGANDSDRESEKVMCVEGDSGGETVTDGNESKVSLMRGLDEVVEKIVDKASKSAAQKIVDSEEPNLVTKTVESSLPMSATSIPSAVEKMDSSVQTGLSLNEKTKKPSTTSEWVPVVEESFADQTRKIATGVVRSAVISAISSSTEKLFDSVLGRDDTVSPKADFEKFVPPTLAEAMANYDRSVQDRSVPVYGGRLGGQKYQPMSDFTSHRNSPDMCAEVAPSAPYLRDLTELNPSELVSNFRLKSEPLYDRSSDLFTRRDEFQYPSYLRPPEGQSHQVLRSRIYSSILNTAHTSATSTASGHHAVSVGSTVSQEPPTIRSTPHLNSIQDREMFLKDMKRLRANLSSMPIC